MSCVPPSPTSLPTTYAPHRRSNLNPRKTQPPYPPHVLPCCRSNLKLGSTGMVSAVAGNVKVDDKYAFMAAPQPAAGAAGSGNADAAWDD